MDDEINKELNYKIKNRINFLNIKNIDSLIKEFIKSTIKVRNNNNNKITTLPLISFIYEECAENLKVLDMNVNHKWLGETNNKRKFETHAEHLCLKNIKEIETKKNLKILVSTQPCINCLRKITKFKFIEINYIVDKKFKMNKNWKKLINENNIKIKKINISKYEKAKQTITTIKSVLR